MEYWVEPRGDQTITIEVYDEETGEAIEDAYVLVDASLESFEGYTDFGEVSFSWTIDHCSELGTYYVTVDVFADGYEPASDFSMFEVEYT